MSKKDSYNFNQIMLVDIKSKALRSQMTGSILKEDYETVFLHKLDFYIIGKDFNRIS